MKQLKGIDKDTAVHCPTEELDYQVRIVFDNAGYKWGSGGNLKTHSEWFLFTSTTCIRADVDSRCSISNRDYYRRMAFKIIQAEEFLSLNAVMPKYYVIKRDADNPLWGEYIDWLNKTYSERWKGIDENFYGFTGNHQFNGTEHAINLNNFKNNPEVITLEFWDLCVNRLAKPEFVLPEAWHIIVTKDNIEMLKKWVGSNVIINNLVGMVKWTDGEIEKGWNPANITEGCDYTYGIEITTEQFIKYVLGDEGNEANSDNPSEPNPHIDELFNSLSPEQKELFIKAFPGIKKKVTKEVIRWGNVRKDGNIPMLWVTEEQAKEKASDSNAYKAIAVKLTGTYISWE